MVDLLADLEGVGWSRPPGCLDHPAIAHKLLAQRLGGTTVINPQQSVELIRSTSFAVAAPHTLWLKCVRSWNPHPKSWSRSLPPTPHRRSEAVGTALVDDRSSVYPTSDLMDRPDERRRAVRAPGDRDHQFRLIATRHSD